MNNEEKKMAAAGKISDKLGDDDYWVSYADNLGL